MFTEMIVRVNVLPEYCHQNESRTEVRDNSSRIFLELMIESSRRKSRYRYVFEVTAFFVKSNSVKKVVFPCSSSVKKRHQWSEQSKKH
jgi:hypothetical protein